MKEFNVIEMDKKVDLVLHNKRSESPGPGLSSSCRHCSQSTACMYFSNYETKDIITKLRIKP